MSEEMYDPTAEGNVASDWEERFETQINTFFDEAIARVPGFVDRHLTSLRRVMGRAVSPKTGVADILIGVRNMASGVSKSLGGPKFKTTTYTHDKLRDSFEREVVSPGELETLLGRLFQEFEDEQWNRVAEAVEGEQSNSRDDVDGFRERLGELMEREISHDPMLAQAIRAGVKVGVPATLGYVLLGRFSLGDAAGDLYKKNLKFYHRVLMKMGGQEVPNWVGAAGWAGGLIGTLAVGGLMEYTLNNLRDIKGQYIRQLNTARYVLLYGEDPDTPEGRGILHIVRGLERQFQRLPDATARLIEEGDDEAFDLGEVPEEEKVPSSES